MKTITLHKTVRAKGTIDGMDTLGDAALALEELAKELRTLDMQGWKLAYTVDDDYAEIV